MSALLRSRASSSSIEFWRDMWFCFAKQEASIVQCETLQRRFAGFETGQYATHKRNSNASLPIQLVWGYVGNTSSHYCDCDVRNAKEKSPIWWWTILQRNRQPHRQRRSSSHSQPWTSDFIHWSISYWLEDKWPTVSKNPQYLRPMR